MSAPTCQSCKHWDEPNPPWPFGACQLAASGDGKPDHENSLCYAIDSELYGAGLLTKATFSCNQHQPRET
jgi:hypothetical protein